jgi:hypothetical protein
MRMGTICPAPTGDQQNKAQEYRALAKEARATVEGAPTPGHLQYTKWKPAVPAGFRARAILLDAVRPARER